QEIIGVNELFKELGALVHEQGEHVDSIEASVEKTEYSVSQGTSQLRQANELSNKLRRRRCFMFLILAGILSFLYHLCLPSYGNVYRPKSNGL
ncbi:hypothetical protein LSTR_LSTR017551, partial [Laodelphax striatellus]